MFAVSPCTQRLSACMTSVSCSILCNLFEMTMSILCITANSVSSITAPTSVRGGTSHRADSGDQQTLFDHLQTSVSCLLRKGLPAKHINLGIGLIALTNLISTTQNGIIGSLVVKCSMQFDVVQAETEFFRPFCNECTCCNKLANSASAAITIGRRPVFAIGKLGCAPIATRAFC